MAKSLLSQSTRRRIAASVCLLALFALQAPVIGGAILATGLCCTGDHCPITAHHHHAAKTEEAPMDCGHNMGDSGDKLRSCSMSCCNRAEQSAVHAHVFVLFQVMSVRIATPRFETLSLRNDGGSSLSFSPLSPPPKSFDSRA